MKHHHEEYLRPALHPAPARDENGHKFVRDWVGVAIKGAAILITVGSFLIGNERRIASAESRLASIEAIILRLDRNQTETLDFLRGQYVHRLP